MGILLLAVLIASWAVYGAGRQVASDARAGAGAAKVRTAQRVAQVRADRKASKFKRGSATAAVGAVKFGGATFRGARYVGRSLYEGGRWGVAEGRKRHAEHTELREARPLSDADDPAGYRRVRDRVLFDRAERRGRGVPERKVARIARRDAAEDGRRKATAAPDDVAAGTEPVEPVAHCDSCGNTTGRCVCHDPELTVRHDDDAATEASRRWDGEPETDRDKRFFGARESGYRGPIDQDGNRVDDLDTWIDQRRSTGDGSELSPDAARWASGPADDHDVYMVTDDRGTISRHWTDTRADAEAIAAEARTRRAQLWPDGDAPGELHIEQLYSAAEPGNDDNGGTTMTAPTSNGASSSEPPKEWIDHIIDHSKAPGGYSDNGHRSSGEASTISGARAAWAGFEHSAAEQFDSATTAETEAKARMAGAAALLDTAAAAETDAQACGQRAAMLAASMADGDMGDPQAIADAEQQQEFAVSLGNAASALRAEAEASQAQAQKIIELGAALRSAAEASQAHAAQAVASMNARMARREAFFKD